MTEPIKLPPLPEWSKMDDLNGFVPSEIRQHLIEYARTSIEADRQARGEPCLTCNDNGAVGNILNAEPCPDCTTASKQQTSEPVPPVRIRDEGHEIYLDGIECQYSIERGAPWPYSETLAYVFDPDIADQIVAALNVTPQPQQIPEGYKLVPHHEAKEIISLVDTLIASINAAHHANSVDWRDGCFQAADHTYEKIKAMLEAAPEPKEP